MEEVQDYLCDVVLFGSNPPPPPPARSALPTFLSSLPIFLLSVYLYV